MISTGILENGVSILQSLIALDGRSGGNADADIELEDGEEGDGEPEGNGHRVVLIGDVVDAQGSEDLIRDESPNHVEEEGEGGEVPGEEAIEFDHGDVGLLVFPSYLVDLFKFPLFILLFQFLLESVLVDPVTLRETAFVVLV